MMEFWEFLLQKEGDRSWLPLESPNVEILEGRYRVVARSSRAGTALEIQLTHDAIAEIPPVRRVQRRTSQTNKDGLVVILPYTRLQAGSWELRCTPDLMGDMMGERWQHTVRLHVLSVDAEDWSDDDWPQGGDEPAASVTAAGSLGIGVALDDGAIALSPDVSTSDPSPEGRPAQPAPALLVDQIPTETPEVDESSVAADLAIAPAPMQDNQTGEATQSVLPDGVRPDAVRLVLDQTNYVVQQGQPLTISGYVASHDEAARELEPLHLQLRLFNPQDGRVLAEQQLTVEVQAPFTGQLALPTHYQTHLLLGELSLSYQPAPTDSAPDPAPIVLSTQSFTATTDLHELLEAIANSVPPASLVDPMVATVPLQLPTVSFPSASSTTLVQFQPAASQPLPPQLHQPEAAQASRSIQLPSFGTPLDEAARSALEATLTHSDPLQGAQPLDLSEQIESSEQTMQAEVDTVAGVTTAEIAVVEPETGEPESLPVALADRAVNGSAGDEGSTVDGTMAVEAVEAETATLGQGTVAEVNEPNLFPVPLPIRLAPPEPIVLEVVDDLIDPTFDWDAEPDETARPATPQPEPELPPSPEDMAFRSLNLQNRFWSRLQSLATEASLSSDWQSPEPAHLTTDPSDADAPTIAAGSTPGANDMEQDGLRDRLAAQEIVVEDDPPVPALLSSPPPSDRTYPPAALVLPVDQPVPVPKIDIPTPELTAGKSVAITAKLPGDLPPRIFVKLWLIDRQSRALLDGPRWLVDFLPDGRGSRFARTQLVVPFGSLDVQVEAIAVEMATQRESSKTILTRKIVPSDLPAFSLDEAGF